MGLLDGTSFQALAHPRSRVSIPFEAQHRVSALPPRASAFGDILCLKQSNCVPAWECWKVPMPPLWVLDTPWVALVRSHIWPVFDCRSRACLARCRPVRMPSPRDIGIDLLCSLRAFQRALACPERRSIEGDMALGVWLARWLAHRRGPALLPASRTLREFICEFTRLRNATLARASPIRVTHILSQTARPLTLVSGYRYLPTGYGPTPRYTAAPSHPSLTSL